MLDTPIDQAVRYCKENKVGLLSSLIQSSVNPNAVVSKFRYGPFSRTQVPLLSICVAHDALDCIQYLISNAHANVETADGSGMRPIHWACALNRAQALDILLKARAIADPLDNTVMPSPFLFAARHGSFDALQRLADANVDTTRCDSAKRTALHLACWFGHDRLLPILLRAQGNTKSAIDVTGKTPLHIASWFGNLPCCLALIEAGAPIDAQDIGGWTALHFAARHNRPEIARALVQAGANTRLRNSEKRTAENIAVSEGFEDIVQVLESVKQKEAEKDGPRSVSDFMEEHNHLKQTVKRLAIARDAQLEQFNSLKERIESQQATIEVLKDDQAELQQQITQLVSVLDIISHRLRRLGPPENMCKLCKVKEAVLRCRVCRSPFCDSCTQQLKTKGCPFCRPAVQ